MLLTHEIRLILLRHTTRKVKGVGVHAAFTVRLKLAVSKIPFDVLLREASKYVLPKWGGAYEIPT